MNYEQCLFIVANLSSFRSPAYATKVGSIIIVYFFTWLPFIFCHDAVLAVYKSLFLNGGLCSASRNIYCSTFTLIIVSPVSPSKLVDFGYTDT